MQTDTLCSDNEAPRLDLDSHQSRFAIELYVGYERRRKEASECYEMEKMRNAIVLGLHKSS